MLKIARTAVIVAMTILVVAAAAYGRTTDKTFADGIVSDDGAIRLPANFRNDYVMLGAWSVAGDADTGGEIGLHLVYASKGAVESYRQAGVFPDGTVLVKELLAGETESLTTGQATRAADVAGYFVMVKDDRGRFPGHPLWGDGWGWAFFTADNIRTTVTEDYRDDCLACHEPARSTDLVYIQAYPLLR